MSNEIDSFQQNSYLELGQLFPPAEVAALASLFESDQGQHRYFWNSTPGSNIIYNTDILVTHPELDGVVRHPRVMPLLESLLGEPPSFWEISLRHVKAYSGEFLQTWHRDFPHRLEHPRRIEALQLMIYLTDVDETTPCFSLSPEADDTPILEAEAQLARGTKDFYGPAGTALLFNVSALHTLTQKPTEKERKSIQIYYGARSQPNKTIFSLAPRSLWGPDADAESQGFYGNYTRKMQQLADALGGP